MDRIDIQIRAPHVQVHTHWVRVILYLLESPWHRPISQDLVVSVCGCGDGLPLPPDDEEEDTGGDAEDDGEHGHDGREDHVVEKQC